MTDIRAKLDTADFASLAEAARAVIPASDAGWSDHNIHDPGIMLIELLAHIADMQIYSLSRLRQDERLAFAGILNTRRAGPEPSRVLLWPSPKNKGALAVFAGQPIPSGRTVTADLPGVPPFRSVGAYSLSGIRIDSACTESPDGQIIEWGDPGLADRAVFHPFAANPSSREALVLRCRMMSPVPLNDPGEPLLALGIEVAQSGGVPEPIPGRQFLALALRQDGVEMPLRPLTDGTSGLFRTGILQFARPRNADFGRTFDLVLRPGGAGLMRRPGVWRIAFDVLEAEQAEEVTETVADFGNGLPDQAWKPGRSGQIATAPLKLQTLDPAGVWREWVQGNLDDAGPDTAVFNQEQRDGPVRFGNGVNGRVPVAGEVLEARYSVTDGAGGNLAAVTRWTVHGLAGPVWFNPLPATGGTDAETLLQLQARVRRGLASAPLCVTAADLVAAVRRLQGFGADALVLPDRGGCLRGAALPTVLMAWLVEPAIAPGEPDGWQAPSPVWLAEVRAKLRASLPVGQSLDVVAPVAVRVGISATLELEPRADAAAVLARCRSLLRRRLAARSSDVRDLGLAAPALVALSAVRGWLRAEPGVRAIRSASLTRNGQAATGTIILQPNERCVPDIPAACLRLAGTDAEDRQ